MQFNKPTTKEELHATLKDIFFYYRIKKAEFEQEVLYPISLTRLEFSGLTEEQLMQKASDLVRPEQLAELSKVRLDLLEKKEEYFEKVQQLTKAYNDNVEKVMENYNQSVTKIQEEAIKRGVGMTSVVTAQLNELENKKNAIFAE